jgi:hypothetical protein
MVPRMTTADSRLQHSFHIETCLFTSTHIKEWTECWLDVTLFRFRLLSIMTRSHSQVSQIWCLWNCTRPLFRHEMKLIHMCVTGAGTERFPGPMFFLLASGYMLHPAIEILPLCTFSLQDATRFIKITGPCTYINLPSTQTPLRIVRHSKPCSASNTQ